MTGVAGKLDAGQSELESKLQELQSQIEALVEGGFVTGVASGKLRDAYTRFTGSAKTTVGALGEVSRYLRQSVQAMQEMDQLMAARIN
jgi:WXG100 family type VII secretion target